MILPYRCKNPPEQFPFATIGLIAVNVVVYLFTAHDLLVIKDGIVADYAVSPSRLSLVRLIASMFLHGEPLHIGGNMLFLWLFGAAVEGRMRIPKFLLLYFASGIVGGIVQCMAEAAVNMDIPGFGASGAIMGLAGAYLFIFPFARIMVFRFFWIFTYIRFGPSEWLAWWVVAYYMGLNILNAIIQQSLGLAGGTAYFAHIGGFATGCLGALLLKVRRDSEFVSQVQANRTDLGHNFSAMKAYELAALLDTPTENMNLALSYCEKAMVEFGMVGDQKALAVVNRYKAALLESPFTERLSNVVLRIPKTTGVMPGPFYLRLGGKLEQIRQAELAISIYRRAYEVYGKSSDGGAALVRMARLWEQVIHWPDEALNAYTIYVQHYPNGPLLESAQQGITRINRKMTLTSPLERRQLTYSPDGWQGETKGPGTAASQLDIIEKFAIESPRNVQPTESGSEQPL